MVAEQFVGLLFMARTLAHMEHLKTTSYAEHKALQAFYEGVLDLADSFAEQYQGAYGKRMNIPFSTYDRKMPIKDLLEAQQGWIESSRYKICEKEETALQNTIDEIVGLYQTTAYLLTLK